MSFKILFIPVGGTVCTRINAEGYLSVCSEVSEQIIQNFLRSDSPFARDVSFECTPNLGILSENMSVSAWNLLLDTVRSYTANKVYDGIIFAHGTDSLAYSASLFSMLLDALHTPIFFVSSNAPLAQERANGQHHFNRSVDLICRRIPPNVYVVYRNVSDGKTYLHMASQLRQCADYSEDFYSEDALDISDTAPEKDRRSCDLLRERYPAARKKTVVDLYADWHLEPCVLQLKPYVGLRYDTVDYAAFRAVLHGTYHSGTVCVIPSVTAEKEAFAASVSCLLERCAVSRTQVYFAPARLQKGTYQSVSDLADCAEKAGGTTFLYGSTMETAYAKLLILYSVYRDVSHINALLTKEWNCEFVY